MPHFPTWNRRDFLFGAGAGLLTACAKPQSLSLPIPPAWTPLGTLAARKSIDFGFALNVHLLESSPAYTALAVREATIVTPENAMKWEAVHPAPDKYTFDQADTIAGFAQAHGMKLRGHTFCWHRALPPWVTRTATKANAEDILHEHIATVAGRYKGSVYSWDVVNEAIQIRDKQPDGWRDSFWYQMLGANYVDAAFYAAKSADPHAILTYNDYGLEYENGSDTPKRATVLAMLRNLKKRGVPVEALGMQSHLRAGTGERFGEDLPRFLQEVRDLGLQIFITEMDVDDSKLTVEGNARDVIVADVYKRYLDLVLGTADVSTVITWGVWDIPRVTGAEAITKPAAERPLLFDSTGGPKEATTTVADCFRKAPVARL